MYNFDPVFFFLIGRLKIPRTGCRTSNSEPQALGTVRNFESMGLCQEPVEVTWLAFNYVRELYSAI